MLPITDLITAWTPGCDADEVEIFREAAHELGGILVVKCVNQLQVKFVIQFNKRRSRLARVSGLVVLMLEQQRAHVHRPLEIHLVKALMENQRFQQGANFKDIMDVLERGAADFNPFSGMYMNQLVLSQGKNRLPDGSTSKPQQRLELRLIDELSRGQIFLQNHRLDLVIRDLRQTIPPFIHHCRHWHILLILYVIYDRHIEKWLYLQHRWCHYTSIFSRGQGFKVGKNG